jgi:hypothetical protein
MSVGVLLCDIDRAGLVTVVKDAEDDQLVTWGDADAITARVGASTQRENAGCDRDRRCGGVKAESPLPAGRHRSANLPP